MPQQDLQAPAFRDESGSRGLDAGHLIPNGALTRVAVLEHHGLYDVYDLCANGHPPIASLPLVEPNAASACEVCAAIREGQRRIDAFLARAAVRGCERV